MDPNPSGGLEEQIDELRSRVRRLEEALHGSGIVLKEEGASGTSGAKAPVDSSAVTPGINPRPTLEPQSSFASPGDDSHPIDHGKQRGNEGSSIGQEGRPRGNDGSSIGQGGRPRGKVDHSLESRIGSQWFNRIGILAVLIGMAWFLKLAIDNHWIGPLGRVLIGLVAGGGIIAWSERFQHRGYPGFGYSLKALGSGILYLSLWAGFSLFHLIPAGVAFAAMIVVTVFNGYLSWDQDSELLAVYAIVGGFATPLLISTGGNHEVTLFSYLLVLDVAVLVLVALRPWSRLLFGAFMGTVLFYTAWWFGYYSDAQSLRTAFFLGCFFLIFAFAPRLIRFHPEQRGNASGWDGLALLVLPIGNAGLGFLGFYSIFDASGSGWAGPWLAVSFAAFYLLLPRLPTGGILHESPAVLPSLHLTAAVVFLTIAIPLKAHGRWLTIGWLAEGAALMWLSLRVRSRLLSVLSLLCLTLGFFAMVAVYPPASTTPFFNQRFATFCFGIAVFAFVAWVAGKAVAGEAKKSVPSWHEVALGAALAVNLLILLAIGWEIHSYWWYLRWRGDWHGMHDYQMYAQFTYSAFFMVFGAILLGVGFWRSSGFLRWQALLLLSVAIGKVFLKDVSELSQGYRILSFLGLGALLLAISFVYQRDWLNLRGGEKRPS